MDNDSIPAVDRVENEPDVPDKDVIGDVQEPVNNNVPLQIDNTPIVSSTQSIDNTSQNDILVQEIDQSNSVSEQVENVSEEAVPPTDNAVLASIQITSTDSMDTRKEEEEEDDDDDDDDNEKEEEKEKEQEKQEADLDEEDDEEEVEENDDEAFNEGFKLNKMNGSHTSMHFPINEQEPSDELDSELSNLLQGMMSTDDITPPKTKESVIKFHSLLLTSRGNERRLIGKIRLLTSELNQNVAGIAQAMKMSHIDRSSVVSLKKELKKAWKLVEQSNEKEARNKQMVEALKNEVASLSRRSETKSLHVHPDANLIQLIHSTEDLQREINRKEESERILRSDLSRYEEKNTNLQIELNSLVEEMTALKDFMSVKREEQDKDTRIRERLDRELRDARSASDTKNSELRTKTDQLIKQTDDVHKLELQLKDVLQSKEQLRQEADALAQIRLRLEAEYDRQLNTVNELLDENQQLVGDIKMADEDVLKLRQDMKTIVRLRDTMEKKVKLIEEVKHDAETERDALRSSQYSIEREVGIHRKQAEADKKQIEDLVRERDILSKNYLKAQAATQKQANLVKLHEQTKRNLEQEISGYKEEASKQRKIIFTLEKERDRYINDASQLQALRVAAEEELKIKDNQVFDCKKKLTEAEHKLKQQQSLYEQVRSDRNLYSKNLIESQDEITEMRRKLKIMSHQIEQYKEEISSKEGALLKEHFERLKVEKEREGVKGELQKLKQQLEANHQFIQSQQAEERKLQHIITEADVERLRQKKEYEAVIQERDILGTQLIRRNDELALLYEKIKIQQSTLNKGEVQYRERLEDVRVLKLEIKKLRREKTILQHETTNVDALRSELYRFQKELLGERTRVKVLEEELENPMNIHRWRKLSGSDPATYEFVQKIQTLQRRLIGKTEQVVEKELLLQAKEKLYQELKNMLSRVPGPEVAEQAEALKAALREKTREMKAMASELNMYHAQVHDSKQEIEHLNRQVQEAKRKYFEVKKRSQQPRNDHALPPPKMMLQRPSRDSTQLPLALQSAVKYLKRNSVQTKLEMLRAQHHLGNLQPQSYSTTSSSSNNQLSNKMPSATTALPKTSWGGSTLKIDVSGSDNPVKSEGLPAEVIDTLPALNPGPTNSEVPV